MTKLLEEAIALDDEKRAAVRRGVDQARRGEFVSDADMAVFFKRHGVERSQKGRVL